jgi:hypothetical protein
MADDRETRLLPDWAAQYYVAGRAAAMARLAPIYGNLLHHAIEMFLKTALIRVVSPKEMKNKYGHNIEKLWDRFKTKEADRALDRFDATICALHAFENLRYPDNIPDAAILVNLTWQASDAVEASVTAVPRTRKYEFFMSDVDELVIEILKRVPLNPKALTGMVSSRGREALAYQNSHRLCLDVRSPADRRGPGRNR